MALNVFDQLSVGIVLLDRHAKVVFANTAARALAADGGPVRLDSCMSSTAAPYARRLDDLIRAALGGTAVRAMSLPSAAGGHSLIVLVSPVRGADGERSDILTTRPTAAIVMLCNPDCSAQIPVAWIRDAFGLTPAESRVAIAIASGVTVAGVARRLGVSTNTVKTHLRRVFEKTGTSRQAELSRLMATISLARGSESAG